MTDTPDIVISRALRHVIHAIDRERRPGQKSVTAICGKRCSVNRALRLGYWDPETFTCVGCRAIIVERYREEERARLHTNPQY